MRRINRCLNSQLMEICLNSMELEGLNTLIKSYLPPHIANYCNIGSFVRGSLTLAVSNAAWATELRYNLPELRDRLRKEAGLYQLTGIKLIIEDTKNVLPPTKSSKTLALTMNSRSVIHCASEQCNYEPLKEALQKLANLPE
ncbi:DUF721 domain-containing protein [Legionella hackeliae]|uniref:DUF721 domain-containing protein n=1 Tax=Legionella hackeliae TaxID=449 RepID=A0A0A8USP2_LEGHA|nr:DUF721 domain-containing protein [Legionella hackeliae]KTD12477.1 hypothetical protein Lhac_1348 [Legionella hackeliae]CEK11890.1 conserved protein of unknown function [Legionella hackeliae]STX48657.1 Zn-ribbon-containing, possible RNA-binding protein-like protein [Legionella hackeliae]